MTTLLVLLSSFAFGAADVTLGSASSTATAGGGRASVEAGDIHSLNPAMLVHQRARDFHSTANANAWTVGLTDNAPDSAFPGALSYARTRTPDDPALKDVVLDDLRLTIAGQIARSNFSVGVTGSQTQARLGAQAWRENNADVGFAWIARKNIGVGLVFYDVLPVSKEHPSYLQGKAATGLGVNYLYSDFVRLRGDITTSGLNDTGRPQLQLGYEASLTPMVLFRMGYGFLREPATREVASAGLGLSLPRFRIDYGFQTSTKGDGEPVHAVDLGIPF